MTTHLNDGLVRAARDHEGQYEPHHTPDGGEEQDRQEGGPHPGGGPSTTTLQITLAHDIIVAETYL